ncbi:MAG: dTMP kinase [Rhodocyclales bacterium]|nr:dTMP kinase [Rhodocyclales bacterium]
MGEARPRSALRLGLRRADHGLHRRKGDRAAGRPRQGRLGIQQPAEEGHAAANRPERHLRHGRELRRQHPQTGSDNRYPLQYLHARRAAADADRHAGPGLDPGRPASAGQRALLFRRPRRRIERIHAQPRRTQSGGCEIPETQRRVAVRGKFITLEGLDGAGKSTHLARLVALLRQAGKPVVQTREPGGTPLGEKLRGLLLAEPMHLETEALLMFAARREHLDKVILPALERGDWVVCDRFTDASFAYQGGGRGLSVEKLGILENWVQDGLDPDLTLLFDVSTEIALGRVKSMGRELDRFEQEKQEFFERVRAAYLARARANAARFRVIDSGKTLDSINVELEEIVSGVC